MWGKNHIAGKHENGESRIESVKAFARTCCMLSYRSRSARCSLTKFRNSVAHLSAFTHLVKALRSNLSFTSLRCRFRGFRLPDFCPSAFTLAEVLITLTILGVIAVIVVPNTIRKVQDIYTVTRLKKAVSNLESAIELMYALEGTPDKYNYPSNANIFHSQIIMEHLSNYLNVEKKYLIINTDTGKGITTGVNYPNLESGNTHRYMNKDSGGKSLSRNIIS